MASPFITILLVAAVLGIVLFSVNWLSRRYSLTPEVKRKMVHISMGIVALSFPWLFNSAWPVVLMAVLSATAMAATRLVPILRKNIGGVLHDVERESLGEIYFPLAIALLFVLSDNKPVLYVVPLLVLALADAMAALIGVQYGTLHYSTSEGSKSAEGSISFFVVSFFSSAIPLFLLTDDSLITIILVSLVIGILVMLFEAISVGGFDNLLIPIGCFGLLQQYHLMSSSQLIFRLGAVCMLIFLVFFWRRKTTLKGSGLLAAILVGYTNWMVGGWHWLATSMILYLTYTRLWPKSEENRHAVHTVRSIAAIGVPGMIWLTLSTLWPSNVPYFTFVFSYGAHLTIIGMLQLQYARTDLALHKRVLTSAFKSWLVFLPAFFLPLLSNTQTAEFFMASVNATLLSAPLFILAAFLHTLTANAFSKQPQGRGRWLVYSLIAVLVSTMGFLVLV